ncbi:hypothetical protein TCAL_12767 [Tigriopus californicus]|uniref:Neuroblastoma-amplified sequence N-terminal domain-containing protein n=1 Tax=Tigriopus californicus TaxID=6832 RepID=A0A553PK12_TIGCA|nr:uncharacterized protein LOC131891071 [Tigriopus californicus]TRY78013.1 hypothetical protein TCAL_12767 [Tigriopus californicus]
MDASAHPHGSQDPLLYEIVVFQEWTASVLRRHGSTVPNSSAASWLDPPSWFRGGSSWSAHHWPAALGWLWGRFASEEWCHLGALRLWRRSCWPQWKMAVRPDCQQWVVLREDDFELYQQVLAGDHGDWPMPRDDDWGGTGGGYVMVHKEGIDPDAEPRLRRVAWSPDLNYVVWTQSDGSVRWFDIRAQALVPHVVASAGLGWSFNPCVGLSFLDPRGDSEGGLDLLVVLEQGQVLLFTLSSGQVRLSDSLDLRSSFPNGLTDATVTNQHGLVIVSGSTGSSRSTLKCARITDEKRLVPFDISWPKIEGLKTSSKSFAYKMALSWNQDQLAVIMSDNSIVVLSVPSFRLISVLPLVDQACHDEVNPQCVKDIPPLPGTPKMAHDFLAWVSNVHWWDDGALAILRVTGSFTILTLNDGSNLLGPLPEFFSLSVEMQNRQENGFLLLEESDSTGSKQRTSFKVLYFHSSSPQELFLRKISEGDFGEAIILARHYHLDTDLVYLEQWRNSSYNKDAVNDCLGKLKSNTSKIVQAITTVPDSLDDMEILLKYGIRWASNADAQEESKLILTNYLERLYLYEKLGRVGQEILTFHEFRQFTMTESVLHFARNGAMEPLLTLLREHWTEIEPKMTYVLLQIPEGVKMSEMEGVLGYLQNRQVPGLDAWLVQRIQSCIARGFAGNAIAIVKVCQSKKIEIPTYLSTLLVCFETLMKRFGVDLLSFDDLDQMSALDLIRIVFLNMDSLHLRQEIEEVLFPLIQQLTSIRPKYLLVQDLNAVLCQHLSSNPPKVWKTLNMLQVLGGSKSSPISQEDVLMMCFQLVDHLKVDDESTMDSIRSLLAVLNKFKDLPGYEAKMKQCRQRALSIEVMIVHEFIPGSMGSDHLVELPLSERDWEVLLCCWTKTLDCDGFLDQLETMLRVHSTMTSLEKMDCVRMFLLKFVDQAFHTTIDKMLVLRHSKAWSKFCRNWEVSLSEEDWSDLAVKSCQLHFKHSPTCQSPSMWCAKSCLNLAAQDKCGDPLVRFWTHLLALCDIVKAKSWTGLVTPMEIFNGCRKNPKRFFTQLCNKVELKERNLKPLLEIAMQMAQAGCPWNEEQLKGEILGNMTRSALTKGQLDLALHLANQIAIGRHSEGGQLCFEVANTVLAAQPRSLVSSGNSIPVNVMSFALNWIPKEDLSDVTNQLIGYTSIDRWEPC